MDFKFIRDTNANRNCRNYAYCNTHCNGHCNIYSYCHSDGNCHSYSHRYSNADGDCHSHGYSYCYRNGYGNGYGNRSCDGDTNSYYKTFSYAKIEAGTKAPADRAPATVAGITRLSISC